eukprot:COSAG03_NODE_1951_length_3307_cov_16.956671_2_plen_95_part_00
MRRRLSLERAAAPTLRALRSSMAGALQGGDAALRRLSRTLNHLRAAGEIGSHAEWTQPAAAAALEHDAGGSLRPRMHRCVLVARLRDVLRGGSA